MLLLAESEKFSDLILFWPIAFFFLSFAFFLYAFFYKQIFLFKCLSSDGFRLFSRVAFLLMLPGAMAIVFNSVDFTETNQLSNYIFSISTIKKHIILTTLLSAALPFYVFTYAIIVAYEEKTKDQIAQYKSKSEQRILESHAVKEEVECQRDYLAHLLMHLNSCIEKYSSRIHNFLKKDDSLAPLASSTVSPLKQISTVAEAVRIAYQRVRTVPRTAKVEVVLLCEDEKKEFLIPFFSNDGEDRVVLKEEMYEKFKEHFRLANHNASLAVASVVNNRIYTVENTEEVPQGIPFRRFLDSGNINEKVKSMVAIPLLDTLLGNRWVLCLSCNAKNAFQTKHEWKAAEAQRHLLSRINLLEMHHLLLMSIKESHELSQTDIKNERRAYKKLFAESAANDYQKELVSLKKNISDLKSENSKIKSSFEEINKSFESEEISHTQLKIQYDQLKQENAEKLKKILDLEKEVAILTNDMNRQEDLINELKATQLGLGNSKEDKTPNPEEGINNPNNNISM